MSTPSSLPQLSKKLTLRQFQELPTDLKIDYVCSGVELEHNFIDKYKIIVMLGRPRTCMVGVLAYALGYSYVGNVYAPIILFGALLSFLWSFSANLHNTYTDFKEDAYNLPGRLYLVARLGYRNLYRSLIVCNILKIIIAAFMNLPCLIFAVLVQPLVHQYSFPPLRLKGRPIIGVWVFSLAVVSPFVLGVLSQQTSDPLFSTESIAMMLFLTVWFMAKGFFKNVPDYYGDKAANLTTSATIFSSWKSASIFTLACTVVAYLALIPIAIFNLVPLKVLISLIWLIPVVINCLKLIEVNDGAKGNYCLKIDMLISVGFIITLLLLTKFNILNIVVTVFSLFILFGSDWFGIDSRRNQDTSGGSNLGDEMIIAKIAWRNLWRNRRRTLITLCVMSFSVAFMIYMVSLATGYHKGIIANSVKAGTSHIQIHKETFHSVLKSDLFLEWNSKMEEKMRSYNEVKAYSLRIKSLGLASYTNKAQNITLWGVNPKTEPTISVFHNEVKNKGPLVEGSYLKETDYLEGYLDNNPHVFHLPGVLIGKKMAEHFDIRIGSSMVVTLQSAGGEIKQNLFQVRGIFQTLIPTYDARTVIIHHKMAQKMLSYSSSQFSEVAIVVNDYSDMKPLAEKLKSDFSSSFEILTWDQIHPNLVDFIRVDNVFIVFFVVTLFVVTSIGIVITLLMSVFERVHEFGVMLAIGMKESNLKSLILAESLWLSIVSCICGSILISPVLYMGQTQGIDVSYMLEGASLWAISLDPTIYTEFSLFATLGCFALVICVTLIVSLYPAKKATKMEIVQAMNFV
ncbi:UbiA family prenyltransferase [Candidatus Uabimicrobium sp. HlEnr_7]|uniref:UbiA family prenyltransferase n=1 Tax=Candidatus Uabimicrobium helgolandensis TaxID=3095367 RepID=UPI0035572F90